LREEQAQQEQGNQTVDSSENYKSFFAIPPQTHELSSLSRQDLGQKVVLHGYLGPRSDVSKKLSFVPLLSKDGTHSIQIISVRGPAESPNPTHANLKSLNRHTPVAVRGSIKERQPSKSDSAAGDVQRNNEVELELEELIPLNIFPRDLEMTESTNFAPDQRHLQLRMTKGLRDALSFRSRATEVCRSHLRQHSFIEIETPLLFKSTPEGAREFLVPTRTPGLAYALPQSPQQYKQILMASGIANYFQVARCFRDEDLRADRQPEFTQLDLEMSFATGEDVVKVMEGLLKRLWKDMLNVEIDTPFVRMKYHDAMAKYGSDKPDLRLGMEIINLGELLPADLISKIGPHINPAVDCFKLHVSDDPTESRRFITTFLDSVEGAPFLVNPDGQPGVFIYDSRQPLFGLQPFGFQTAEYVEDVLNLEDGDLIILQARKKEDHGFSGGYTMAGRLRLALHKAAAAQGLVDPPDPKDYKFLWITEFPLFTPTNAEDPGQGGAAGLSSTHHPFTSPKSLDDISLLETDPLAVKAEHYDIVLNGIELGGGSRRIHSSAFQEYILRDVLKMPAERLADFEHLLQVLRAGCPPHAGIALGFDRLIATMLGRESIRDVLAFPKSGRGEDLLVKSPSPLTPEQLETYHLRLKENRNCHGCHGCESCKNCESCKGCKGCSKHR
jgi:aspartyl-tRNA synthetase